MSLSPNTDDLSLKVARLEAENAALKSSLMESDRMTPPSWQLTKIEQMIFRMLLTSDLVRKADIVKVLHSREIKASDFKNIDVFILRIRRKTKPVGVKIETILRHGYRLVNREDWLNILNLHH